MTALSLRTDRLLVRSSASSVRHLLITVEAPEGDGSRPVRQPVDVAFVLDRSGSMNGQKIELARDAIAKGLSMLSPADRFAIVAYDDRVDVVAALGSGARERAAADLALIDARGSTNLSGGWLTACMQLAEAEGPRDIRKCLLMSDGQANAGITDTEELQKHAAELRERGIVTSTFGVGDDFDEELMTGVARAGGGHAYYIAHANQITDLLTSDIGETLETVLHDVELRVSLPDGVTIEVMSDFSTITAGRTSVVHLGHMVAGQSISVLARVECPAGDLGRTVGIGVSVVSREHPTPAQSECSWTYASDDANEQQARTSEVDAEVAKVQAALARREALRYNRRGDFVRARQAMTAAADSLAPLAAIDLDARTVMDSLHDEAPMFSAAMRPSARKEREYAARGTLASRDASGRARRSSPDAQRGR